MKKLIFLSLLLIVSYNNFCLSVKNEQLLQAKHNIFDNKLNKLKDSWWKLPQKARNLSLLPAINGYAYGVAMAANQVFTRPVALPLSVIMAGTLSPSISDMLQNLSYWKQTGVVITGVVANAVINTYLGHDQYPHGSYQFFIAWALLNLKHLRDMHIRQPLTQEQEQAMQELQEIANKAQITEDIETGRMGEIVHEEA